jgi:hypothetical protein
MKTEKISNESAVDQGKKLIDRVSIKEHELFLDGKSIFNGINMLPAAHNNLEVVGLLGENERFLIGTGSCCSGYFISIARGRGEFGEDPTRFYPGTIRDVDMNVYDIVPIHLKNPDVIVNAVLTAGSGCDGSGARLVSTCYASKRNIVISTEEYDSFRRVNSNVYPNIRIDARQNKIYLDMLECGYRLKSGHTRNCKVPNICIDFENEDFYVSQNVRTTWDLTERLTNLNVDIDKTVELNKEYRRIKRS